MRDKELTIAIIDPSRARAAILEEGLRAAGVERVIVIPEGADLMARLAELDPDIVVIDLQNPSRDVLEHMVQVSRPVERPVAMFVDHSDAAMMQAAVDAGVSAYVIDGLKAERVKSVVDVAIARFNAFARLQRELTEVRTELAERKLIDRAKGIVMKAKGLGEDEAYALLRRTAMNRKCKISDIAQSIITSAELLG